MADQLPKRLKIKKVLVFLTPLEADLIRHMRQHQYGQGRFKMKEGQPFHLFFEDSNILSEEKGLDIPDSVVVPPGKENAIINKLVDI